MRAIAESMPAGYGVPVKSLRDLRLGAALTVWADSNAARKSAAICQSGLSRAKARCAAPSKALFGDAAMLVGLQTRHANIEDRKSTRLNSSHVRISYAVFCLKKKNHLQLDAWAIAGNRALSRGPPR